MNDFKVTIKGNTEGFNIKINGDNDAVIIASIMQFVCKCAISSNVSKKEFLKSCANTYKLCKEDIEESESEENE